MSIQIHSPINPRWENSSRIHSFIFWFSTKSFIIVRYPGFVITSSSSCKSIHSTSTNQQLSPENVKWLSKYQHLHLFVYRNKIWCYTLILDTKNWNKHTTAPIKQTCPQLLLKVCSLCNQQIYPTFSLPHVTNQNHYNNIIVHKNFVLGVIYTIHGFTIQVHNIVFSKASFRLLRFHYFHFRFDSVKFSHKNRSFGSVLSYLKPLTCKTLMISFIIASFHTRMSMRFNELLAWLQLMQLICSLKPCPGC